MHFLLVNDDGFDSPELLLLCRTAAGRGHRVSVAAPMRQQSGTSHSFTVDAPLMVEPAAMPGAAAAWRIAGTPADCTRLGLMALAEQPVDLVISGINRGWNIGTATYVSGTVGAAREAAFQQGRALAVSMEPDTPEDMRQWFADYAVRTAEKLVTADAPERSVCNLNAPRCPRQALRGVKVCPICSLMYVDNYTRFDGPRGQISYWLQPMAADQPMEPGSDMALLEEGWATMTFLTPMPCEQEQWADFPVPVQACSGQK